MSSKRFSRRSRADAGFSFIELLVTMGITGVVLTSLVQFFAFHAKTMRQHSYRVETQQALRGALDAMVRDVRLAGACLPTNGSYIALAGTDSPAGDSITVRTGIVRPDLTCVSGTTNIQRPAGSTTFTVDNATGFEVGKLVYVRDLNGSGELREVSSVNTASNTVGVSPGVGQLYPAGSALFAVDQRTYALRSDLDPPILTLQIDQEDPQAFAAGIEDLDFDYVLAHNCPSCEIVDLSPQLTSAQWWTVNEVLITATAKSVGGVVEGDENELTQYARAKPRNLLP
jgi:prepilin-type N-terminal cleavage/methylation domain-containing protein